MQTVYSGTVYHCTLNPEHDASSSLSRDRSSAALTLVGSLANEEGKVVGTKSWERVKDLQKSWEQTWDIFASLHGQSGSEYRIYAWMPPRDAETLLADKETADAFVAKVLGT